MNDIRFHTTSCELHATGYHVCCLEVSDELARLRAENAAQLAELHRISDALGTMEGPSSVDHIVALRRENAELRARLANREATDKLIDALAEWGEQK